MLTGDKLETATCIAKSSKLVSRDQDIYSFKPIENRDDARNEMNNFRRKVDTALVILGESLEVLIIYIRHKKIKRISCAKKITNCFVCSLNNLDRLKILWTGVYWNSAQLSGGGSMPLFANPKGSSGLLAQKVCQGSYLCHRRRW